MLSIKSKFCTAGYICHTLTAEGSPAATTNGVAGMRKVVDEHVIRASHPLIHRALHLCAKIAKIYCITSAFAGFFQRGSVSARLSVVEITLLSLLLNAAFLYKNRH